MKRGIFWIIGLFPATVFAQKNADSSKAVYLKEVTVTGIKTVHGTGHMPEVKDGIIYAGKKMKL